MRKITLIIGLLFISGLIFADQAPKKSKVVTDRLNPNSPRLLIVEIKNKSLKLFINEKLVKQYQIATGKPEKPTPVGEGFLRSKGRMIFRYDKGPDKGKIKKYSLLSDGRLIKIPYSKMLGFGIVIPGYNPNQYYIHSTTEEDTIGQNASKGCVRMRIKDMLEFFKLVEVGDKIIIKP